jgi:hypothetical protein
MHTELIDTVWEWFETLDYEYMILHVLICYGIYHSNNLKWLVKLLKTESRAIWVMGILLGLVEVIRFLPHYKGEGLVQKITTIFHSFLVVQVLVEHIVTHIQRWVKKLITPLGKNEK